MSSLTAVKFVRVTVGLGVGLGVAGAVGLVAGAESVGVADLFSGDARARFILFELRLPRVLVGAFVGGALACAGAAFQGLMRNVLASPFILGVSGGGSLGAVSAILLGIPSVTIFGASVTTRPLFAFGGCLGALLLIFAIAQRRGHLVPQTLLLAGVVANAFFLAVLGFLHYVADPHQSQEMLRWMMGGLYGQDLSGAFVTGGLVLIGTLGLFRLGRALNLLSLGEETAMQLGVSVGAVRRQVFLLASLTTGAAVAASGPIGFVGLFVPHGVRLLFGADHRLLLPASFLAGGAFLVLADAAARVLAAPGEMPVGLVTAAIGAPCFIILLVRGRDLA